MIYCLYRDQNNKYKISDARPYQIEAFNQAQVFFQSVNISEIYNTEYEYNNNGYIFKLKKSGDHHFKMIKDFAELYHQYLVDGDTHTKNLLKSISCPICDSAKYPNPRYYNAVCNTCAGQTVTKDGEKINFANTSMFGGFESQVNGVIGQEHECYISGKKCYANEAKFGGIVVLFSNENENENENENTN